jgi:hypothetical protein
VYNVVSYRGVADGLDIEGPRVAVDQSTHSLGTVVYRQQGTKHGLRRRRRGRHGKGTKGERIGLSLPWANLTVMPSRGSCTLNWLNVPPYNVGLDTDDTKRYRDEGA